MYKVAYYNQIAQQAFSMINEDDYQMVDPSQEYDALLLRSKIIAPSDVSDKVLYIGRAGAGVNNIAVDEFTDSGVVVCNAPGANANAVKELVILGMLLSSRDVLGGIEWVQSLRNANRHVDIEKVVEQNKNHYIGPEIAGKTLGVIGLGSVGVSVANAASALKVKVIGFDPFISVSAAWGLSRKVKRAVSLDEIFINSDYITIHIPLMEKTKGYINASHLKKAKPGLRLLNFARGGLIDNDDLKEYLENGTVARYITDFPDNETINLPHTLCIPHLGASTPESEINCAKMVVHQMIEYLEHGNIINSVNYPEANMGQLRSKCRLTLHNRNVPNMIGQMTGMLSNENINIANMVNSSKGGYAYTMIDVESDISDELVSRLLDIDGVIRVRRLVNENY